MRFAVVQSVYQAALQDKRIFFITGDLGHAHEKEFLLNLPEQYINTGLSEQNMIGIAAGLALTGKKVFAYSIVPFITLRCYEQIKNDVCYQNLDVNLIGIGGGFAYGKFGNTHCSIEDIAAMRALPNMRIVCPANPQDAKDLTKQILKSRGPIYIRIGRGKEPLPSKPFKVSLGKGYIYKIGDDITIFSTGTALTVAEKSAENLEKKGVSTEVVHMHTVKPIDKKLVIDRLLKRKGLFTVEDHNILGGLGSSIAEIISENYNYVLAFKRFGVNDKYLAEIGSEEYLREKHGYDGDSIAKQVYKILKTYEG